MEYKALMDNVKELSQQLTILQDYVTLKFGKDFKDFSCKCQENLKKVDEVNVPTTPRIGNINSDVVLEQVEVENSFEDASNTFEEEEVETFIGEVKTEEESRRNYHFFEDEEADDSLQNGMEIIPDSDDPLNNANHQQHGKTLLGKRKASSSPSSGNCSKPQLAKFTFKFQRYNPVSVPFQNFVTRELSDIKTDIRELLRRVTTSGAITSSGIEIVDFPIKFPMETPTDVLALDRWSKDEPGNEINLIQHLSTFGGQHVGKITRRIMKELFSSQLARKYNFSGTGTSNKHSFCTLNLKSIVIFAVKRNKIAESSSVEDIEKIIANWFRNSRDLPGAGKRNK